LATAQWGLWRFVALLSAPWWLAFGLRWTVEGRIGFVVAAASPIAGFVVGLALSDRLQESDRRSALTNVLVFLAVLFLTNALMGAAFLSIELVFGGMRTR
jgi:hypothetical protein